MIKDMDALLGIICRDIEIFDPAKDKLTTVADPRHSYSVISEDIETLCDDFGFCDEGTTAGISLSQEDLTDFKDKLSHMKECACVATLYVRFWHMCAQDGYDTPFTYKNVNTFLAILVAFKDAVFGEIENLYKTAEEHYNIFQEMQDEIWQQESFADDIEDELDFISREIAELNDRYDFSSYEAVMLEHIDEPLHTGKPLWWDSFDVLERIDGYMEMGALYCWYWQVSPGIKPSVFDEENLDFILEILSGLKQGLGFACRYCSYSDTLRLCGKLSPEEMAERIKRIEKKVHDALSASADSMLKGTKVLQDMDYWSVSDWMEPILDAFKKICSDHVSELKKFGLGHKTDFEIKEWQRVISQCDEIPIHMPLM